MTEMTVFPYFSEEERSRWRELTSDVGSRRDLYWIVAEGPEFIDTPVAEPYPAWPQNDNQMGIALIQLRRRKATRDDSWDRTSTWQVD